MCPDSRWERIPSVAEDVGEQFRPAICVSTSFTTPLTWDEALDRCRQQSAHLLVLADKFLNQMYSVYSDGQERDRIRSGILRYATERSILSSSRSSSCPFRTELAALGLNFLVPICRPPRVSGVPRTLSRRDNSVVGIASQFLDRTDGFESKRWIIEHDITVFHQSVELFIRRRSINRYQASEPLCCDHLGL